jgi:hypothetical protein
MRHSYGTIDKRNILLYKPQLFHKTDDLLVFPSKDFQKWHSELMELLDGIYQIDSRNRDPAKYIENQDLNLTIGLLLNINEELENIFNPAQELDYSYQYISMVDDEYKKRQGNFYSRYIDKINRRVIKITPEMKYRHMMEILNYAHELWAGKKISERIEVK